MTRCVIIDDEPLAIDVLKRYVLSTPGLTLEGTFIKPVEGFAELQQKQIEILFLDIQMPGLTGLELIRSLQSAPKIILTTAYREFAAEGFELDVLDYLVKPVAYDRFLKAIGKYYSQLKSAETVAISADPFIFMKVDKEMIKLKFDDIYWIEGMKNYVRVKTVSKDLIVYHTLTYLEDKLPTGFFKRVHKSFIINLKKIDKFSNGSVIIHGQFIPVGRLYQSALDAVLEKKIV